MIIHLLGYDPEADELDLLIDSEAPLPAEAVPLAAGIYLRRERETGRIVGAFVRGYSRLVPRLYAGEPLPEEEARAAGLSEEFHQVVDWLRETASLAERLLRHVGVLPEQRDRVDSLLELHATTKEV